MPFTLSGKTGKLVIEVTEESKEKKNKVYTYTLFYGSDERRADFLTDGTDDEYPDLAVCTFPLFHRRARSLPYRSVHCAAAAWRVPLSAPAHRHASGRVDCPIVLVSLSRHKPPSRLVRPGTLKAPRCSSTR